MDFMLYDEHLEYSKISKEEYEYNLEDISNGDAKLIKSILIFAKNKNTNEIKQFEINTEKNDLKNCNLNDWKFIVKYYVEKIKQHNIYKFHCQEIGEAYYIYGVGYFYISEFYKDMKHSINEEIKCLFKEYDNNYHSIVFPFTDEEFIVSNSLQK